MVKAVDELRLGLPAQHRDRNPGPAFAALASPVRDDVGRRGEELADRGSKRTGSHAVNHVKLFVAVA